MGNHTKLDILFSFPIQNSKVQIVINMIIGINLGQQNTSSNLLLPKFVNHLQLGGLPNTQLSPL